MTPAHNESSTTTTMTESIVPSNNLNLSGKEFEIKLDKYGSDIKFGSTNENDMILSETNDDKKSCHTTDEISLASKKSVSTCEKNYEKVTKKDPCPEENISLSSRSSSCSSTEILENKEAIEESERNTSCEEESYSDDSHSSFYSKFSNSSMESKYDSSNLSSYTTDDFTLASGYYSYSSATTMSTIGGKQAMKIPNNLLPRKNKNYTSSIPKRLPPPNKISSKNKNCHDDCSSHVEKCATVAVSAALSVIENGGKKEMAEEVAFAVLSSLTKTNIHHSPEEQKALGFLPAIAAECSTAILASGGSRELAISAIVLALKHIEKDDENDEQSRSENKKIKDDENDEQSRSENKKIEISGANCAQNQLGYTKENLRPTKNNQTSLIMPDGNRIYNNNISVPIPPKTTNVIKKMPRRKTDDLMTIKENVILVNDKNKKEMIRRQRVTKKNDFETPTDSRDLNTQIRTPIVTSPFGNSHERESFGSKKTASKYYDDSTTSAPRQYVNSSKSEKKKKRKSKNSKSKYSRYYNDDEIAEIKKLAAFNTKKYNHQPCAENCLSMTSPIASKVGTIVADARVSFSRSLFQALKESGSSNSRGGYDDNEILEKMSRYNKKRYNSR